MTNKNVSQLPINSDPQDSDWLLGASGNSPSVFQKIPVGSLIPTTQNSGSIKFSLPVNQNTALTSSGYYFTDNIAGNIAINCSDLEIGDHISWVNLSTKDIIFYGLSTVNGGAIPAYQGVKLAANNSLDFFIISTDFSIKIISGSFSFAFIPGQEPPIVPLIYSSFGDTNGLFYYFGTNGGTTAFSNPVPVIISGTQTGGASDPNQPFTNLTDRVNNGNNSYYSGSGGGWTVIYTLPKPFILKEFIVKVGTGFFVSTITIYGSNDGTTWVSLGVVSPITQSSGAWSYKNIGSTNSYTKFKLVSNVYYSTADEIEFYGDLINV